MDASYHSRLPLGSKSSECGGCKVRSSASQRTFEYRTNQMPKNTATAIMMPTESDLGAVSSKFPATTLAELQRGRALYVAKCAGCHQLHVPAERTPLLAASETAMRMRFGMSPMLPDELLGTSMMVRNQRFVSRS